MESVVVVVALVVISGHACATIVNLQGDIALDQEGMNMEKAVFLVDNALLVNWT